jgi:hypothetical protein
MALVKISQLPAAATILPTIEMPTNNAGINEKITISDLEYARVKSIAADYVGTLIDSYTQIHFNHSASTGLIEFTLPNCAASAGRAYFCQNLALGLSYINGDAANILFKGQALSKILLVKGGDKCWIRSNGSYWIVEDYYMCIESGFYNRSDYTSVEIGFANFDYDNQSDSSDRTGFKYALDSGVTGLCLADSAPSGNSGTLTVCFVIGTGLAINDEEVTFGDAVTADVNEGSGDNKNQNWNITHNMGISFRSIQFSWAYSTDKTEANTYVPMDFEGSNGAIGGYGEYLRGVDLNEFQFTTATNGFFIANDTIIDTEDHYVCVKAEISA